MIEITLFKKVQRHSYESFQPNVFVEKEPHLRKLLKTKNMGR